MIKSTNSIIIKGHLMPKMSWYVVIGIERHFGLNEDGGVSFRSSTNREPVLEKGAF